MKPCATFISIALLTVLQSISLWWGSGGDISQQLIVVMASALGGALTLLWIVLDKRLEQTSVLYILLLAFSVRIIAIQAVPLLEDDQYRYLWDGLRTATTLDPYRLAPSMFWNSDALSSFWLDIVFSINHADVPTIYGPVLQGLFALAYLIAPGKIGAIQSLLFLADMGVLLLLIQQKISARALLIYAVHPLILKEAMASAHPDGLVALLLLLALIAWRAQQVLWMGVSIGLAIATKISALVALPLFLLAPNKNYGRWSVMMLSSCLGTLLICYAPFMLQGASDVKALSIFSSQWRFNPLLYRLLENAFTNFARPLAATLILLGVGLLAWRQHHQPSADKLPAIDYALMFLLLLSPVVNPWYGLWLIAPALLLGRPLLACALTIVSLAYLNTTVLLEAQLTAHQIPDFRVSWPLTLIQLAILGAACYYCAYIAFYPLKRIYARHTATS